MDILLDIIPSFPWNILVFVEGLFGVLGLFFYPWITVALVLRSISIMVIWDSTKFRYFASVTGMSPANQFLSSMFKSSVIRQKGESTYVYVSGGKELRFSENLACFVFLKYPFWNSPFCLITDELVITKSYFWVCFLCGYCLTLRKNLRYSKRFIFLESPRPSHSQADVENRFQSLTGRSATSNNDNVSTNFN